MKLDEFINGIHELGWQAGSDPRDLSPGEISHVLSAVSHAIDLARGDPDNNLDSSFADSSIKLTFLRSLLKELGDNFFPMAHTNERLEKLRIITISDLTELLEATERLHKISSHCSSFIDIITRSHDLATTEELTLHREFFEEEGNSINEVLLSLSSTRQQLYKIFHEHQSN